MQIEQLMNGSPPEVFTPGWRDGAGLSRGQDIPVANLFITRGVVESRTLNTQVAISGQPKRIVPLTLKIRQQDQTIATLCARKDTFGEL